MTNKQKYYAVKQGNKTGIFLSWEECQEAVKGFPKASYKSFGTEAEAKAFLDDEDLMLTQEIMPRLAKGEVVAFTDGSFDEKSKAYGSGVYIFAPDNIKVELSSRGNNAKYIDLRNIAGEIIAVLSVVDWAWKNGYEIINIFYDYEGVEKWANGEWRANKNLTQYYSQFIKDKSDVIKINFIKVKGHSNNKYNDRADLLAKGAVLQNKIIRNNGNNRGYIINNINENQVATLLNKIKDETTGFDYTLTNNGVNKVWAIQFQQDRLKVSLFNDIKMVVQGKQSNLFQLVTTSIVENNLIHNNDFIQVLKSAYEMSVDKEKIENDFKETLPAINKTSLPSNVSLLLKQAVINLNNPARGDIEFTMYAFPVLKALEGVLKFNLSKCNIPMNKTFDMFDKDITTDVYFLKTIWKNKLDVANVTKLENCYNHLYNNRHTLFHFGIIIGGIDSSTRILKTKEEANLIIKDTLEIIDNNYIN